MAGTTSQVTGLIASCFPLVFAIFMTPVLFYLPQVSISAIIMIAGLKLIEVKVWMREQLPYIYLKMYSTPTTTASPILPDQFYHVLSSLAIDPCNSFLFLTVFLSSLFLLGSLLFSRLLPSSCLFPLSSLMVFVLLWQDFIFFVRVGAWAEVFVYVTTLILTFLFGPELGPYQFLYTFTIDFYYRPNCALFRCIDCIHPYLVACRVLLFVDLFICLSLHL